jgi:hypothetical protein
MSRSIDVPANQLPLVRGTQAMSRVAQAELSFNVALIFSI